MSVFRVEKNKGYTVMSNHHLRNHEMCIRDSVQPLRSMTEMEKLSVC